MEVTSTASWHRRDSDAATKKNACRMAFQSRRTATNMSLTSNQCRKSEHTNTPRESTVHLPETIFPLQYRHRTRAPPPGRGSKKWNFCRITFSVVKKYYKLIQFKNVLIKKHQRSKRSISSRYASKNLPRVTGVTSGHLPITRAAMNQTPNSL